LVERGNEAGLRPDFLQLLFLQAQFVNIALLILRYFRIRLLVELS